MCLYLYISHCIFCILTGSAVDPQRSRAVGAPPERRRHQRLQRRDPQVRRGARRRQPARLHPGTTFQQNEIIVSKREPDVPVAHRHREGARGREDQFPAPGRSEGEAEEGGGALPQNLVLPRPTAGLQARGTAHRIEPHLSVMHISSFGCNNQCSDTATLPPRRRSNGPVGVN